MSSILLRRRKLGNTSCNAISRNAETPFIVRRNDVSSPMPRDLRYLFRWGCTSPFEAPVTVNTAIAISSVGNKKGFRRILQEAGICPRTWFDSSEISQDSLLSGPVFRPAVHHQGRNIWRVQSMGSLLELSRRFPDHYLSEFIDKVAEYRVFVVQGRVVCVARKYPANAGDLAWNVFRGGRFVNVNWGDWNLRVVKIALKAMELSELDFGGVDVMVDEEGNAYVLEINAAPSLTSDYRQRCFALSFDYIVRNGKDKIPLIDKKGGYRKFIHPAIDPNALIGR